MVKVALSLEIGVPFGLAKGGARPDVVCTVARNLYWVPILDTPAALMDTLRVDCLQKRDNILVNGVLFDM
jgi:hypothetical protein